MGLRFGKSLRLGRLVRLIFSGSSVSLARGPDDYGFWPRFLGELVLVAALVFGGYLIGRFGAPNCAPAPDANCIEAQAPTPVAPTPVPSASVASAPKATVPVATPPKATAPLAPAPLAATPPIASSAPAPEVARPTPPSTPTASARPLRNDEVREMQAWLKAFGFDPGPLDDLPGSQTMTAVKRYQAARHSEETGFLDRSLLRQVRKEAGQS
jgi:Putative peptidoglycan binding domain